MINKKTVVLNNVTYMRVDAEKTMAKAFAKEKKRFELKQNKFTCVKCKKSFYCWPQLSPKHMAKCPHCYTMQSVEVCSSDLDKCKCETISPSREYTYDGRVICDKCGKEIRVTKGIA